MQTKESEHFDEKKVMPAPMQPTYASFEERYFKYLPKCKTQEEAYELAAKDYNTLFGVDKYSCYNSFRNVKNKRLKNK
jgi:hypothetical protein